MISTHHHNGVITTPNISEELQEKCSKAIEVIIISYKILFSYAIFVFLCSRSY